MTVEMRNDEQNDQFPVGMRVLAVDDDHTCLRLIETLLRKCQYHVTTRDRAIDALNLLRENRDDFDLVISDVQMPDMDGFKLLELVGLEMDLPVIMLSTNGDTKMVMKGITHGACDYLLKPIRLEELKNIWQHVLRRKKTDKKDQTNSDNREKRSSPADEEQNCLRAGDSDNDGRYCKRRKDQNEDEDDEEEENDEDSSSQKKARVVWSVELHRKFVAAVNQLGFERAVPKKILELMNVDKLSRENVASHLQKYRLYLKRLSSVANQQANMVAALGGADSPYLRMNPMGFHNFNATSSFPNNNFRPLPPAGMLGRLNSPVGISNYGISPSGIAPLGHPQMTDSTKFQLPRDQTGNILQGMPTSLEFDQLQIPLKKNVLGVSGDFSNGHNNPLLLQDHSSGFGFTGSNRNTANWPLQSSGAAQSTSYGSSQVGYAQPPLGQAFNSGNNGSSLGLNGANLNGANELQIPPNISRFDARCEAVDLSSGGAQNMGFASKPVWSNPKITTVHHPEFASNSMNPPMAPQGACLSSPIGNQRNMNFGGSNELGFVGQIPNMNSSSAYHMAAANVGALTVNGAGSLEDVVTSMIKWEQEGSKYEQGRTLI